ncbi:MAG: DNA primase [Planctomycetota bacterium]
MDPFERAKEQIKERIELADLVQADTPVQRRGRTMVALCPFHGEKSPSFTIYPESQRYKCYGCGVSGDVFTYVAEHEGVSFREAMERLADQADVSLEGVFGAGRRKKEGPDPHKVLEQVRDWFEEQLWSPAGERARVYLEKRGLLEAAEEFGLGFHPEASGAFASYAKSARLPLDILAGSALLEMRGGSAFEKMRGRVMFPIQDDRGRICGFGGRVLPDPRIPKGEDRRPKYLNSPEAPWFSKRRILYGLRQAKRAQERQLIVVEGYTDVVALHLAGFGGAVATLGTALTTDHAKTLSRYATEGVVLLFDGDSAGARAADRAFRELVNTPLPVRIALLQDGADPADMAAVEPGLEDELRTERRAQLEDLVEGAGDALSVWFRLWRQRVDLGSDVQVQRVASECGRVLGTVEDQARREALRAAMALQLGLSERAIQVVESNRRNRPEDEPEQRRRPAPRPVPKLDKFAEEDADLLACVLGEPELVTDAIRLLEAHHQAQGGGGPESGDSDANSGESSASVGIDSGPEASQTANPLGQQPPASPITRLLRILGALQALGGWEHPEEAVRRLFTKFGEDPWARSLVDAAAERASRNRDPRGIFAVLRRVRTRRANETRLRRLRADYHRALTDSDQERAQALMREYTALKRDIEGFGNAEQA